MASFLYCSFYSFRSSKVVALKGDSEEKSTHIAIAFKSEKEQ
jgi:hypothetical protein